MAYRVRVSKTALSDADSVYVWMKAQYSERAATKWYNGLVDAVQSLSEFPNSCPYAPEREEIGIEIRHLFYGKRSAIYRIVFAVEQDERTNEEIVQVFRIWHGARDRIKASDLEDDE